MVVCVGAAGVAFDWCDVWLCDAGCGVAGCGGGRSAEVGVGAGVFCAGVSDGVLVDGAAGGGSEVVVGGGRKKGHTSRGIAMSGGIQNF